MRILVTGSGGMLGRRLVETGWRRGHHVIPVDLPSFDLAKPEEAAAILRAEAPEAVIHGAAYTDVDGCETRIEEAMAINGEAVGPLAAAAAEMGAHFLVIGTDYVFDGGKGEPYLELDPPNPQTVYGRSKLRGETLALEAGGAVARLSWLFGPEGGNFVKTITGLLEDGKELKVVDDQFGRPTYSRDAAEAIMDLVETESAGIWHVCNEGECNWFDFAVAIAENLGLPARDRVRPCTTEEYPRPAPRPADSRLDTSRLTELIRPMPHWRDALNRYMEEEGWLVK